MKREATRIGFLRELHPGEAILRGREMVDIAFQETGRTSLSHPVSATGHTPQLASVRAASNAAMIGQSEPSLEEHTEKMYGYYEYSLEREHWFVPGLRGGATRQYFHSGERQRLTRSLIERALNRWVDRYREVPWIAQATTANTRQRGRRSKRRRSISDVESDHQRLQGIIQALLAGPKTKPASLEDLIEQGHLTDYFPLHFEPGE